MTKNLYIFRHGNIDKGFPHIRCADRSGHPLSPLGIKQAFALSEFLADKKIDLVVSSPYDRALNTARIAVSGHPNAPIITDTRLVEAVYFWEPSDDAAAVERSAKNYVRIAECVRDILDTGVENIAFASHGCVTSAILSFFGYKIKNPEHAGCFCLSNIDGKWELNDRFIPDVK